MNQQESGAVFPRVAVNEHFLALRQVTSQDPVELDDPVQDERVGFLEGALDLVVEEQLVVKQSGPWNRRLVFHGDKADDGGKTVPHQGGQVPGRHRWSRAAVQQALFIDGAGLRIQHGFRHPSSSRISKPIFSTKQATSAGPWTVAEECLAPPVYVFTGPATTGTVTGVLELGLHRSNEPDYASETGGALCLYLGAQGQIRRRAGMQNGLWSLLVRVRSSWSCTALRASRSGCSYWG